MKHFKKISLLLAALTLSSSIATAASAGGIFLPRPDDTQVTCPTCGTVFCADVCDDEEDCKTPVFSRPSAPSPVCPIFVPNSELATPGAEGTVYKKICTPVVKPVCKPVVTPSVCLPGVKPSPSPFDKYWIIGGGKYYTVANAKKELEAYFEKNSCDVYFQAGDERSICSGAYFYSTNPEVVSYNHRTGMLEAHKLGYAEVYVYTTGGVPFYRLDVSVVKTSVSPTLTVSVDNWNPAVGDTVEISITASNGKVYDDIALDFWTGHGNATFIGKRELLAQKNGAVILHAYSMSDPSINGKALLYVGGYTCAVTDGYWKPCDGGIYVDRWDWDICDSLCSVKGWIKSTEGILIPVLKFETVQVNDNGTLTDATILTHDSVTLLEYLQGVYADKGTLIDLINKYNFLKYGFGCDYDKITWCDIDYRNLILSQLIGGCLK
ncbi:MAG: hypothetical protein IJC71_00430 [Clostridia bacterium]|nr:hypothetical protein [Clostridia bacterium]